jgi:hypothetical protein
MKKALLILLVTLLVSVTQAQVKIEIGPQVNAMLADDFSIGAGGFGEARYMISKSLGLGLSAGFQHIFMASDWQDQWYKEWGTIYYEASYNILPIRATVNYYFGDGKIRPYAGFETGITKFYEHYTYDYSGYGEVPVDNTETKFAFAPQAGLEIGFGKSLGFDMNFKYNGFDLDYLSFKFGIVLIIGGNK